MKTWHEIVEEIQTKPEFSDLVTKTYFSKNIGENYRNYSESEEASELLKLIASFNISSKKLLDVGCGNGITSVLFAKNLFDVTCVEPDRSNLVGSGAIEKLMDLEQVFNIEIINCFAEDIPAEDSTYDIAFARQSMHHANDLHSFCKSVARVLKSGGVFLTIRDHVVYNEKDKQWFLESHPLHKFYGGENAYTIEEYKDAFIAGGFEVIESYGHFDTVINSYPMSKKSLWKSKILLTIEKLVVLNFFKKIIRKIFNYSQLDESLIPGRHYTFIARKK
jgi:ubiquinone/menaquinone biosynthesis C-methylase UbiE